MKAVSLASDENPDVKPDEKPYEKMTVKELKAECKLRGLKRYSALRKMDLIKLCYDTQQRER